MENGRTNLFICPEIKQPLQGRHLHESCKQIYFQTLKAKSLTINMITWKGFVYILWYFHNHLNSPFQTAGICPVRCSLNRHVQLKVSQRVHVCCATRLTHALSVSTTGRISDGDYRVHPRKSIQMNTSEPTNFWLLPASYFVRSDTCSNTAVVISVCSTRTEIKIVRHPSADSNSKFSRNTSSNWADETRRNTAGLL